MRVHLRTKFQVYKVILMSFRHGVILPPTSKRTPKTPIQIRVKIFLKRLSFAITNQISD